MGHTWGPRTGANNIYCLDEGDGHEIWYQDGLNYFACGSTSVGGGKVFINTYNFFGPAEVAALDAGTGNILWVVAGPSNADTEEALGLPVVQAAVDVGRSDCTPAYHDGMVYACGTDGGGYTYCFNADTGVMLWSHQGGVGYICSPVISGDRVLINDACLDTADGHRIWSSGYGSNPVVADGKVFYVINSRVYAVGKITVTGITLNKTGDTLVVGGSDLLTATIVPANAINQAVTWASDNTAVATVDSTGRVTALAEGTATITATTSDGGLTATCAVTVQAAESTVPVTGITLNKTGDTISVGGIDTLTAIIAPDNATNQDVTWLSDNPAVATVDTTGKVTGVSAGNSTITATTDDGLFTATCLVTVQAAGVSVTSVALSKTSDSITAGGSDTLTATITPNNATNQSVTWSSSNTSVATVDQSGKVAGLSAGSATITATCAVTVTSGSGNGNNPGGGTTITVKLTIQDKNKATRFNGNVSVLAGKSVMDVLLAAAQTDTAMNPQVDWNNAYVTGGYLESLYGEDSPWGKMSEGWVYQVNGVSPNKGAARYYVSDGDAIYWKWGAMISGVTISKASDTVSVGGSDTLTYTIDPPDATSQSVTWSSDNTTVATVDQTGKVTGVTPGTATITVTTVDGGKTATCVVTVQEASSGGSTTGSNNGITLNKNADEIQAGTSDTLVATITASGATGKNLLWSSDNPAVAKVDQAGKVSGVSAGVAKITVATADGAYQATCVVTVKVQPSLQQAQQTAQTPGASGPIFKDLPLSHWASGAIEYLANKGYLRGYDDGTFRPDQPVTRAEFASMLVGVTGLAAASGSTVTFSDVHPGDWYYGAVGAGLAGGLISGDSDGRFYPDSPVTREQAASMLSRALARKDGQQTAAAKGTGVSLQFSDAGEISDWARSAVATAISRDLVHGYEDGSFRPKAPATRAECGVMLRKLLS